MSKLVITRGLPASGKSTYARSWVNEDPAHRAEVNRDDIREMLRGGWRDDTERQVMAVRDASIMALLGQNLDVICSDTNLPQRTARDLRKLAVRAGVGFEVVDMTDVPLEDCIRRDIDRHLDGGSGYVGEQPICDMHKRFIAGKSYPLPFPEESEAPIGVLKPYRPNEDLPQAVIVDVDGTVALMGDRNPFDESRVSEDLPNTPVITVVRALRRQGVKILFCSARTAGCFQQTRMWLQKHVVSNFELHMREEGDFRKDREVKLEIFDRAIRPRFNVIAVIDDRAQVVKMWRELGLACLQVAEGDF